MTSIRHAVSKTSGNAAASSNESESGIGYTFVSGTAISSACVPSICSPTTVIVVPVLQPGIDHDALARVRADPRAVGPEDARLRHRREALAHPEIEVVQRRGAQLDQDLAGLRDRIGRVLVSENVGAAVVVYPDGLHRGTLPA